MVVWKFSVDTSDVEAALKRSSINDAKRKALEATADRWRDLYLPLHFGAGAAKRYNYTPRKGDPCGS